MLLLLPLGIGMIIVNLVLKAGANTRQILLIKPTLKPGPRHPPDVIVHVKPILIDKDELLKKCLHRKTQIKNESFNNTIWSKFPQIPMLDWHNWK